MRNYIDGDKLASKLIDIQKECEKRPFASMAEAFGKVVDALCTCMTEQQAEDNEEARKAADMTVVMLRPFLAPKLQKLPKQYQYHQEQSETQPKEEQDAQ